MVSLVVLIALLIMVGVAYIIIKILKNIKFLMWNACLGLIFLAILKYFEIVTIKIDLWVVAITALGGIVGALLVAILAYLGIAFI
ncbi:MAG: pro-sigmaK processing inhibitor BofA family protein [Candidatus Methanofastidiosia archaeon]